jgi:hypothetical protein
MSNRHERRQDSPTRKIDCLPDHLPDHLLKQVLTFVEFLLWQQNSTIPAPLPTTAPTPEDQAWLNTDLSNLGSHAPYDWAEGELEQGKPIKYIPGKGFVIDEYFLGKHLLSLHSSTIFNAL